MLPPRSALDVDPNLKLVSERGTYMRTERSLSLFSQVHRNSSHWPPRPIRTPPGPISKDWEKADIQVYALLIIPTKQVSFWVK
jgi:hypothetical protein